MLYVLVTQLDVLWDSSTARHDLAIHTCHKLTTFDGAVLTLYHHHLVSSSADIILNYNFGKLIYD